MRAPIKILNSFRMRRKLHESPVKVSVPWRSQKSEGVSRDHSSASAPMTWVLLVLTHLRNVPEAQLMNLSPLHLIPGPFCSQFQDSALSGHLGVLAEDPTSQCPDHRWRYHSHLPPLHPGSWPQMPSHPTRTCGFFMRRLTHPPHLQKHHSLTFSFLVK